MDYSPPHRRYPGGDRRSVERVHGDGQAGANRRRDQRRPADAQLVPLGPMSPSGALTNPDGVSVHVKLWDVSEGGLCVMAAHPIALAAGTPVVLELHAGVGVETARVEMEVVWTGEDPSFGTFTGLKFAASMRLPNGTFLDRYLTQDPTD